MKVSDYIFYNKAKFILIIFLKLIVSFGMVYISIILSNLLTVATMENASVKKSVIFIIFSIIYIILLEILAEFESSFTRKYLNKMVSNYRDIICQNILRKYDDTFLKSTVADYNTFLVRDVEEVAKSKFFTIFDFIGSTFTFVIATIFAFYINYIVALIMLGLSIFIVAIPSLFNRKINQMNLELSDLIKDYSTSLVDTLNGIRVIQNFKAIAKAGQLLKEKNKNIEKKNNGIFYTIYAQNGIASILIISLQILGGGIAGILFLQGQIGLSSIVAFVTLGADIYNPILDITINISLYKSTSLLFKQIYECTSINESETNLKNITFKNRLTLKDINVSYEDKCVLKNANYTFENGKKYLIVGNSGAGKSTILNLIMKFITNYDGNIFFDDTNIKEISHDSINDNISICLQEAIIFNDSILGNIIMGQEENKERLDKVIELCSLKEFVESRGIKSFIDHELSTISQGEKQRISLARAIYKTSNILLLDEITASIDKVASQIIEDTVCSLKDRTIIYVAHKYSEKLMQNFDHVIKVEDGKLVAYK